MQGAALLVLTLQLLLWSGIKITLSDQVLSKTSPCSCMYNGGYYNLRSLASKNGSKLVAKTNNSYQYGYNPCIPFTLEGACKNVAVCRWADSDFQSYVALGRQDNVTCLPSLGDGIEISVKLIFHQPGKEQKGWITTIKMKCNRTLNKPKFTIIKDTAAPVLQVEHKCCCSDACPDLLLGPSVISIAFLFIGVLFLLIVAFVGIGICYKKCKNNDNDINDRQQQENSAGSGYELVDAGARRAGADARRGGDRTRSGGGGDDGVVARRGGDDSVGAKRGGGDRARRGGDDGIGARSDGGDRARRGGDDVGFGSRRGCGDRARRGGDDDGVGSRRGGGGDDGVGAKRGGGDRARRGGDDDGVGPRRGGDKGDGSRHGGGDRARCDGGGDDGVVARCGGDDSVGAKRGGGAGARRGGDGDGARHGGAGGAGARCGGGARRGGGGNEEDDKANSMPYVTDDDLVLAVEEQDGKGCSPAIPIPVTTDPEDQCCSDDNVQEDDDVAFTPASHPVEHEEA